MDVVIKQNEHLPVAGTLRAEHFCHSDSMPLRSPGVAVNRSGGVRSLIMVLELASRVPGGILVLFAVVQRSQCHLGIVAVGDGELWQVRHQASEAHSETSHRGPFKLPIFDCSTSVTNRAGWSLADTPQWH